jgi:hypothetical protein
MSSKPDRMFDKTDGKSTGPLRFGIAGRNMDSHGRFPLVKVDGTAYHGFSGGWSMNLHKTPAFIRFRWASAAFPLDAR